MTDTRPSSTVPPSRGESAPELRIRLVELEARFAGIVEIAADAIISIDEAQNIILFNEGAEQIFGYKAEEVLNGPLDVLLPARFRPAHRQHVAEFGAGTDRARRMGHRREISGLRKGGEEFPAEASISRYRIGDAVVYNVVLRDITERKRAEDQQRFLARAGEVLASSLDNDLTIEQAVELTVPSLGEGCVLDVLEGGVARAVAVAHVDTEGKQRLAELRRRYPPPLEGAHPFAEALRSRSAVVLDGATLERLPADDALVLPIVRAMGWRAALFVPLVVHDRTLGVLQLYGARRDFGQDDLVLAEDFGRRLAVAMENARLYADAQRAIRARDETVAIVSHDLRNPVNAITMLAGNLLRTAEQDNIPPTRVEYLNVITRAARQADALIQDLLDISRIEAGRLRIEPAPEELESIIEAAVDLLAPLAAERSLELRLEIPADLPDVLADSGRIHQVVSNLVGNAIKFTSAGHITIRAWHAGREVTVSITDTGSGIAPEHLPYLFDRYWQAGRGPRGGAGLGLPIAKGIIEAHGGRIWVDSRSGEGTTCYFTIPMAMMPMDSQ
ncbi:MAG TPA: ATP-binding protein [Gemmatimonadaceae bacterium]|nr:ATP-binding protein [Gemmatimonadaceae bacterium]